eukprot:g5055.t1
MSKKLKLLVIVGATAVGKTKLSIELAKALNGEIVNGDALQVYRDLNVATAKVTPKEARGVPHHMLSFLKPNESLTVREYRDQALKVIEDIAMRGKVPILVGGTMYYVQSLIWPSLIDEETTFKINEDLNTESYKEKDDEDSNMYEALRKVDPDMAERLHPNDTRKIRRSLEIFHKHGRRHSELIVEQHRRDAAMQPRFDCHALWLDCSPKIHEARVSKRIRGMLDDGLLDEVERLWSKIRADEESEEILGGVTQAIGFKEFLPWCSLPDEKRTHSCESVISDLYLEDFATKPLDSCLSRLFVNTRQYAKKQIRWIQNRFACRNIRVTRLDTSVVENWNENVLKPAMEVSKSLLRDDPIPNDVKAKLERQNREFWDSRDIMKWKKRRCEICDVTTNGKHEWEVHLQSKKHRALLRRKRRNNVED